MFLNDWSKSGLQGIIDDFVIDSSALDGCDVLLASYTQANYEGYAFVLYRKDNKYYEVNGSHCSCYGLEGQWEPEEADFDELWHRVTKGTYGDDEYRVELKALLAELIGKPREGDGVE